ncbi:hypothetical protein UT300012_23600 [Paraclostridium bifermentans]
MDKTTLENLIAHKDRVVNRRSGIAHTYMGKGLNGEHCVLGLPNTYPDSVMIVCFELEKKD